MTHAVLKLAWPEQRLGHSVEMFAVEPHVLTVKVNHPLK
jgi:hypothetical protein